MTSFPFPAFFAVLLMLGAVPATAVAQPRQSEARAMFNRGAEAMNRGRFAEARDAFAASLERFPTQGTAFNLAVVLTRTGEYAEAIALFDELLSGDFGEISRAQRNEVRRLQADAESQLAYLTIALPDDEAGLNVRVDGQRYEANARLDPGEHTLVITSPRHQPYEELFSAERGERVRLEPRLQLRESARLARVVVTTSVSGGQLAIPGVVEGVDRIEANVDPGEYEVRLRFDGRERTREIQVEGGSSYAFELDLGVDRRRRRRRILGVLGGVILAAGIATATAYVLTRPEPRSGAIPTIVTLQAR